MTKVQFTSGPWFSRQRKDGTFYIGTAGVGYNIADHCIADVNNESDAILISVAPEMYEALEAALNMVDGDGMPPNWDWLRMIVAKVRG